jgi:hypothetical protein
MARPLVAPSLASSWAKVGAVTRRETIVQLLERFTELTDPVRSGNGGGSSGLLLMPHEPGCRLLERARPMLLGERWSRPVCSCSMRSVVELGRLLGVMREDRSRPLLRLGDGAKVSVRACWWHLNERYVRVESRLGWRCPRCHAVSHSVRHSHRDRRGKLHGYPCVRVLVEVYDPRVDLRMVGRGVDWLVSEWGDVPLEVGRAA